MKGELTAEINRFYDLFVSSVAGGRSGMTEKAIRATEARAYIGSDAVAVGLADATGSFEGVLSELSGRSGLKSPNPRKGLATMNDTFTAAQLGAAILNARQEERERIRAIMSLPEAASRQALALSIATTTSVTIDEAKRSLSGATDNREAMSASWDKAWAKAGLQVLSSGSREGVSASWDKALARAGLQIS